jgi:hypothetical protein
VLKLASTTSKCRPACYQAAAQKVKLIEEEEIRPDAASFRIELAVVAVFSTALRLTVINDGDTK